MPIPDNTIVDDFVIPLLSKLRHKGRIVYDPEAVGAEETPPTIGSEFRRRVRIGTGAYQSVPLLWRLLNPRYGWTAFAFLSHKILRWLVPFFCLECWFPTCWSWIAHFSKRWLPHSLASMRFRLPEPASTAAACRVSSSGR